MTVTGASVGTKQGFSIIKYQSKSGGGGFSHGLTQQPEIIFTKDMDASDYWGCYFTVEGVNTQWMMLNDTSDIGSNNSGETPTGGVSGGYASFSSTQCYVASSAFANASNVAGHNLVAYIWHSVPGFSKFGSYKGSNSANGGCIYLGFKPEIIIYKNSSATSNWAIYDSTRGPYNTGNKRIRANTVDTEGDVDRVDVFSNGFQLVSSSFPNTDATYLYMAWAKSPFSDLYGGQSNAF